MTDDILKAIEECDDKEKLRAALKHAMQESKRLHHCCLTSLMEATAWMGIPENKRSKFISAHMENADYILNSELTKISELLGSGKG